jgi:hypothetical protein
MAESSLWLVVAIAWTGLVSIGGVNVLLLTKACADSLRVAGIKTDGYWRMVAAYKFLFPARWHLYGMFAGTMAMAVVISPSSIDVLTPILLGIYWFLIKSVKDDHDDNPKKKERRMAALVKSLGHRLVVVPNA